MATTIKIDDKTLLLLKKMKDELNASSYNEAIIKAFVERTKNESMAGYFKKYMKKGETVKDILKELREERRKSDRF